MTRNIAIVLAAYLAAAAVVVFEPPLLVHAMERLPGWLAAGVALGVLGFIGPAVLLTSGADALPLFAVSLLAIAACLWLSRVLWRRFPDSEVFVVFAVPALLLWIAPGVFLVLDRLI